MHEHALSMSKIYNTKEEAVQAVKKAVGLREEWENVIRSKATVEEMEKCKTWGVFLTGVTCPEIS